MVMYLKTTIFLFPEVSYFLGLLRGIFFFSTCIDFTLKLQMINIISNLDGPVILSLK